MSENRSDSIGALAAALSIAQGEIVGAIKDSTNPFFKSTYADLASVWDAVRGPLSRNGLAVIQTTEVGEQVEIVTTLLHKSGEWVRGSCPIYAKALDPQSIGSAITYARRYGLAAIVGVAQIDDDGNAATQVVHSAVIGPKTPIKIDEARNPDPTYAPSIRAALKLTADCDKRIKEVAENKGLKYSEVLIQAWAAGQRNYDELMAWLANYGMEVLHVEDEKPEATYQIEQVESAPTASAKEPDPFEATQAEAILGNMSAKERLTFRAIVKGREPIEVIDAFLATGKTPSFGALVEFAETDQGVVI